MPVVRIGRSKVIPFFPESPTVRRNHWNYLETNAQGSYLLENTDIYHDDYNWWSGDRLPDDSSDRRLRISARNYNEAIRSLAEVDLKNFTRLDDRNISNPKNILRLIVIAFNAYVETKLHFVEDCPRTLSGDIIGYHTDYILIKDNQKPSFYDMFSGRCIVSIDSDTIRNLLFEVSKGNWELFWIKIVSLYEIIFDHYNEEISEPKHLKVKHKRTKLEKEYISRKDEGTIGKIDLIYLLENVSLPEDAYQKIMSILAKDPNVGAESKKELEKCLQD